jgi:signal transduction histidine kinase
MRNRASFVLSVVALTQVVLIGLSLAILVVRLREIRADLVRLGQEEQSFLNELASAESDLYRTSILLRDNIILEGADFDRARQELVELLRRVSDRAIKRPPWISAKMKAQLETVDTTRLEYVTRAQTVAAWREGDRRTLGRAYLSQQLAPTRLKFISTAAEMTALVQSLRESRGREMAASIEEIQSLVVRILAGAAAFGLILAAVAGWRFRRYDGERNVHMQHLEEVEEGLRALSQRLVESQELERKKLSRELHDEVGQILTALRVQMGQIEPAGEASAAHLQLASSLAERSLRSVREMARGLRPAMLDDLGLGPALNWLCRDVSKTTSLDVEVQIEGELSSLTEAQRTCLYRVVQEALNNCVKHARAKGARVLLHESPRDVVLTVQDSGIGFAAGSAGGIGLLGMRERVEELEGEFAIVSMPGSGTVVRATLPKVRMEKE